MTPSYLDTSANMRRADELRLHFESRLGRHEDWLSVYRTYLDQNNIEAEVAGWPSEDAYDMKNVVAFITERLYEEAHD